MVKNTYNLYLSYLAGSFFGKCDYNFLYRVVELGMISAYCYAQRKILVNNFQCELSLLNLDACGSPFFLRRRPADLLMYPWWRLKAASTCWLSNLGQSAGQSKCYNNYSRQLNALCSYLGAVSFTLT